MKSKKLFTLVILLASAFFITSCYKNAQHEEQTSNLSFKLEVLFEKEGCKVYRFYDAGRAVYWTDCRGVVSTEYFVKNGYDVRVSNQTIK